jgi:hypothetical protein
VISLTIPAFWKHLGRAVEADSADSNDSLTLPRKSTCETAQKWAIQDSNLKSQSVANKPLIENHQNPKVHNPVHMLTIYPDLAAVVEAWPNLPDAIKTAIKALLAQAHNPKNV